MLKPLPKSREEIRAIQSERKKIAFQRAKQAPWYRGKLDGIDENKLDDPQVWQRIPIIDKEILRRMSHAEFMEQLCIVKPEEIADEVGLSTDEVSRILRIAQEPVSLETPVGNDDGSSLADFIDYAQNKGGAWFATRLEIANWWHDHHGEFES